MIKMSKKGRPKIDRPIEELNYTTFQQDITMFRNYLIDVAEDEETEDLNIPIINKFLSMEVWKQNLFIIYMLNKEKHNSTKFTFSGLADLLQVNRSQLMRTIREIKKDSRSSNIFQTKLGKYLMLQAK